MPTLVKNPLDLPIQQHGPLREAVYSRLKQAIVDGYLQPGEHLVETRIAERLGVSRNPVREALRRLEQEELVISSWKGMIVGSLTREDIQQVYTVRGALEALCCRLAAESISEAEKRQLLATIESSRQAIADNDISELTRCDIEFHDVLVAASHNATLKKMLDQLRDSVRRYRVASIALPGRPEEVLHDHIAIANAVIAGTCAEAEALIDEHIRHAAERLLSSLPEPLT